VARGAVQPHVKSMQNVSMKIIAVIVDFFI